MIHGAVIASAKKPLSTSAIGRDKLVYIHSRERKSWPYLLYRIDLVALSRPSSLTPPCNAMQILSASIPFSPILGSEVLEDGDKIV